MRILHCIPSVEGGGAERQLCYLATGLSALGHDVHVALMHGGALERLLAGSGATVHLLRQRPVWDPTLVRDLRAILEGVPVDLAQTWLRRMDLAGGVAALSCGVPWVYSERTVWDPHGWRQALRLRLIERASAVVANSENAASWWRERLGPRGRLAVIENALPLDEIRDAPATQAAAFGVPEGAELILYAGRFQPEKNIALLAQALTRVLARRPSAFAICAGAGFGLPQFRRDIEAAGLGARCLCLGFRDDVWSLMKAARVMVSTSRFEGQPNSVLEAMAAGCPLALSDIAGHRELVGDGAVYFSPNEAEDAARAIERVLDEPRAARDRAQRAAVRAEHRSLIGVARRYEALYGSLLGDCSRSARAYTKLRRSSA